MAEMSKERKEYPNPEADALEQEVNQLDPQRFPILRKFAEAELYRIRGTVASSLDLISNRKAKIRVKLDLPSERESNINYVGKLLGPKGATFKQLQEMTHTRMAILGQGSMRNESKERELLTDGEPKYQHLKQKLHMQIDCFAQPADAYYNIWQALCEVRKLLTAPDLTLHNQMGAMQPISTMQQTGVQGCPNGMGYFYMQGETSLAQQMPRQSNNGGNMVRIMTGPQASMNYASANMMQPEMFGAGQVQVGMMPQQGMQFGQEYSQNPNWGGKMQGERGKRSESKNRGGQPYNRRGPNKPN